MDQLRRRAERASGGLPTAHGLAEAIVAVREVGERPSDHDATPCAEQGEGSAAVRGSWEDRAVREKLGWGEGPEAASCGPGTGPALGVPPADIPPTSRQAHPLTADVYQAGRH